jgi:hypothetical protein
MLAASQKVESRAQLVLLNDVGRARPDFGVESLKTRMGRRSSFKVLIIIRDAHRPVGAAIGSKAKIAQREPAKMVRGAPIGAPLTVQNHDFSQLL